MTYKLIIEYNGKDFYGFQRQKNVRTVCGVLEENLSKIFKEQIKLVYASRTDRGVSAYGQVASFKSEQLFDCFLLRGRLNRLLPEDVKVGEISYVSDGFMASRNIKNKTYEFKIFNNIVAFPLQSFNCVHVREKLNISLMKKAVKYLVGTHDFTSFCKAECEKEDKVRTLNSIKIKKSGYIVSIIVNGNGFLQHMVRIIAGTLIDVGTKKTKPSEIEKILEAKDRRKSGKTENSNGLVLKSVEYFANSLK